MQNLQSSGYIAQQFVLQQPSHFSLKKILKSVKKSSKIPHSPIYPKSLKLFFVIDLRIRIQESISRMETSMRISGWGVTFEPADEMINGSFNNRAKQLSGRVVREIIGKTSHK